MARRALPLIALFWVPPCAAHPVYEEIPPHVASVPGVSYFDDGTTNAPCSTGIPDNTVYEIADGQAQDAAVDGFQQANACSTSSSTSVYSARGEFPTTTSTRRITISSTNTVTTTLGTYSQAPSSFITSVPASVLTQQSISAIQTVSGTAVGNTEGFVVTGLDSSQHVESALGLTSIASATGSLSIAASATLTAVQSDGPNTSNDLTVDNIFQNISTDAPPAQISRVAQHPVEASQYIVAQQEKIGTNKFYTNLFLGEQNSTVFLFPYSVAWSRGNGRVNSWGLSVSHTESDQYVHAPPKYSNQGLRTDAGDWAYYINPLGVQSIILSANELTTTDTGGYPGLAVANLGWGSILVNLFAPGWLTPTVQYPLVQGASFVTANYSWSTPLIQTGVGFKNYTYLGAVVDGTTYKYALQLNETMETWLLYITPNWTLSPDYQVDSFTFLGNDSFSLQGPSGFNGLIQTAKLPNNSQSYTDYANLYDKAAGAYASDVHISGQVDDDSGSYTFSWDKMGQQNSSLMMFALPHHIASLDGPTAAGITDLQLQTTVKGIATAVVGESWTLIESNLPVNMSFDPWSPASGSCKNVSESARQQIVAAGAVELTQNISANTNVGSFYYDGKALAKYATIVYTLYEIGGDESLAFYGLQQLQAAFAFHVNGQQQFPLVYDEYWGGAVSNASYATNNSGEDFGNTYYNDHHFHFGYFVYAASVIGYLNSTWLDAGTNKAWVNTLVRDYANPISNDPYFPFSRMFDWFHGHSWASGLFESSDGKNQESSSEDTMASYALKMWGQVTADKHMQARGNLMLAIQARSLQSYYLYESTNTLEPAPFIGNKAAGILFENKIDHTTYFGALPEYTQGIHVLPVMPFSAYIRTPTLVQQEWDVYFANWTNGFYPYIEDVVGGWRGILEAQFAIVDPTGALQFFDNSTGTFDEAYLDDGASLTWYLAFTAALGECAGGG